MGIPEQYPLKEVLEKRLNLPCKIENDARLIGYAESLFGAARGYCRVLTLTLGTGIGVGFVYLSQDKKMLIGYWTAPEGKVYIRYGTNVEHNYVIRGKIKIHCQDGTVLTAVSGDVIECSGKDVVYEIEEYAETLFIVYPQGKEEIEYLEKIKREAGEVKFSVR